MTKHPLFKRPFIASGKSVPPFPLVVVCHKREQAQEVMGLLPIVLSLKDQKDRVAVAHAVAGSSACLKMFPDKHGFYAVVLGNEPGIYFTW